MNVTSSPSVALVSGHWGQNIGNAFFNLGGRWILERAFGPGSVGFVQDQPGYRTFHDQRSGNPAHDWGLLRHVVADYLVLQGPVLTSSFPALWGDTLTELTRRGTRLILLGAGLFRYTRQEVHDARAFLERFRPVAISTRDRRTFDALRALEVPLHDGIDSAFALSNAVTPITLNTVTPHIALGFDRYPEPTFVISDRPEDATRQPSFVFEDQVWTWSQPRVPLWFSSRGKAQAYIGALFDRRNLGRELGGREVVRPEHRYNPFIKWKIYRRPNAVASDEPFTYAALYAGAELTLSDRVHACVATLAYGNPAMLFSPSPRSALFERVGAHNITASPVQVPRDAIDAWLEEEIEFLRCAVT